jgi:hypothetical protein
MLPTIVGFVDPVLFVRLIDVVTLNTEFEPCVGHSLVPQDKPTASVQRLLQRLLPVQDLQQVHLRNGSQKVASRKIHQPCDMSHLAAVYTGRGSPVRIPEFLRKG